MARSIVKEAVSTELARTTKLARLIRGLRRRPTQWSAGWITYWQLSQLPSSRRGDLFRAYQNVFAEKPWEEHWTERTFAQKLVRELSIPDIPQYSEDLVFLTLVDGDDDFPVGAFCWGAVVDNETIPGRVLSARRFSGKDVDKITEATSHIIGKRLVYVDDMGVVARFRGGPLPVAKLCYPPAWLATNLQLEVICWSDAASRLSPILDAYGWRRLCEVSDVAFFYQDVAGITDKAQQIQEMVAGLGQSLKPLF